ncbi:MAG: DUF951 domain-containing protein [Clostridia bacterium]|nr:DUF951 domain-containing protein [Clostridia bacterium]
MSYTPKKYNLGDIVQTKKMHPCGNDQWEIIRVGMDFKLKCTKCGRIVMLPRRKFERSIKKIIKSNQSEDF